MLCQENIWWKHLFSLGLVTIFFLLSIHYTEANTSSSSLCGNSVNYPSFITRSICCKKIEWCEKKRQEVMHVCVSLTRYKTHSGVARITLGIQHNWIIWNYLVRFRSLISLKLKHEWLFPILLQLSLFHLVMFECIIRIDSIWSIYLVSFSIWGIKKFHQLFLLGGLCSDASLYFSWLHENTIDPVLCLHSFCFFRIFYSLAFLSYFF